MAQETQPLASPVASIGHVLLSRPLCDSIRISTDFESLGYKTSVSPVLEITSFNVDIPSHDFVCLSSKNALPALKGTPKDTPIFCVGSATAALIKDLGFHIITHAPTAKDLCALLQGQQGEVLYLAGAIASLDFSEHIAACTKVICYEAAPVKMLNSDVLRALKNHQITHLPLYSARSATLLNKLLLENEVDLKCITVLALSNEIANALRNHKEDLDYKEILTAQMPTHKSLLNLLTRK